MKIGGKKEKGKKIRELFKKRGKRRKGRKK